MKVIYAESLIVIFWGTYGMCIIKLSLGLHLVYQDKAYSFLIWDIFCGACRQWGGISIYNEEKQKFSHSPKLILFIDYIQDYLKDLCNANACWLVLILNNTLIITNVAKRLFKYLPYILL